MKTRKLFIAFICFLFIGGSSFAQPFEIAYHGTYAPGWILQPTDYEHYSIETSPSGRYVLAGTVFNNITGHTDIHLMLLDVLGNKLWERQLDYMGLDDGALDVVFDAANDIVLTGYVSSASNFTEMYVAKYDMTGAFIVDQVIGGFPTASSAGTNIIYSTTTGTYIVGGFHDDPPIMWPLVDGEAVLVELDPFLNPMASCYLSRSGMTDDHSSINDIVEIPGVGYFATGTYETSGGISGVLAVMVDLALGTPQQFSFHDITGMDQVGVSVLYDVPTDEIIIVSNHSFTANPQIRRIQNISGIPNVLNPFDINIQDQYFNPVDASVFQIMQSPWNPSEIILAGRFKFGPTGSGADNNVWLLSIEKSSFAVSGGMTWNLTSPNYESFTSTSFGPLFSTWVGAHPYIYNEEIVTFRPDLAGLTIIAPTDIAAPNFGIDVVTTNMLNPLGCYDPIYANLTIATQMIETIVWTPAGQFGYGLSLYNTRNSGRDWACHDSSLPRKSVSGDDDVKAEYDEIASIENEGTIGLAISPNPSTDIFTISIAGNNVDGNFTVYNSIGKVIYESTSITTVDNIKQIDLTDFENGVYILQFMDGDQRITKKLIKL